MNCCRTPLRGWAGVAGILLLLVPYGISCSGKSREAKPFARVTGAFTEIFGELPSMQVPGPCSATVAYFPSASEPGRFRPAAMFTTEPGKEERLTVRTVVRGVRDAGTFSAEVVPPFPEGSDLVGYAVDNGVARIVVGGAFRMASMPEADRTRAARALAMTATQFGKAESIDLTDTEGKIRVIAEAGGLVPADVGNPEAIGLLAVREKPGEPAGVLSLNFDRPVFVERIAFGPAGTGEDYRGKSYATGFGMTVEFHPDRKTTFSGKEGYRVRMTVRDGKGRKTSGETTWTPKEVVRD
jgi:hypothetical protein